MRLVARCGLLLSAPLVAGSCNQAGVQPSQSLVGAKALPSADELSREVIHISRGLGDASAASLSYELRPDNTLTVTLVAGDSSTGRESVASKEVVQLHADAATEVRQFLSRLRPNDLRGVELETRPVGCTRQFDHDFGEAAVAFIAEGPQPGVEDDRVGIFVLPATDSCRTRQAVEARELFEKVLQLFPPSKSAAEFDRRFSSGD